MEEKSESETIDLIFSLLASENTYVELSQLLSDFEKEAGHSLPLFGHETIEQFLRSISNKIQVLSVEEDVYVKLNTEESANSENDLIHDVQNEVDKVDDEVNKVDDDVNKVDEDNKVDDGVNKVDNDVNQVDDNVKKKDDPSPLNSAAADPSSGVIPKEGKIEMTKEERAEDASEHLNLMSPYGFEEEYDYEESAEKDQEDEDLCGECVPVDVPECEPCIDNCLSCIILDESDIPVINLLDHMRVSDTIRVTVPEVRNPHRFILHLQKYESELTTMMGRMQTFYSLYGEKYTLGDYKFTKNQVCAALYRTNPEGREWYRAKIINFDTLSSTVLLIDYGIVTDVTNANIKYLDRDFGYLPMQALNGHLTNIKPYKGKYWSEDCCKRFYDSVFEEDLVAQVIRMDTERRWLSVILSYFDAQNFLINDNLVRGKFPVADCDFNEDEPFSSVIYDSISPKEFIQAEELGKTRRLKSEFRESKEFSSKKKGRCKSRNKGLRKLCGADVSGESLNPDTE